MPTVQEIHDTIDADLSSRLPALIICQEAYLAVNDLYFQGLCTHSILPADGNSAAPDSLDLKPHYQVADWNDFGWNQGNNSYAMEIHQYDSLDGKGWLAVPQVSIAGEVHLRIQNTGPDTWRDVSWNVMPLEE